MLWLLPFMNCLYFWHFISTTALIPLGRYEPSSPISCCAPQMDGHIALQILKSLLCSTTFPQKIETSLKTKIVPIRSSIQKMKYSPTNKTRIQGYKQTHILSMTFQ